MSEPTRYSVATITGKTGMQWGALRESPDGDMVPYADYATLRTRLEAVEKERDRLRRAIEDVLSVTAHGIRRGCYMERRRFESLRATLTPEVPHE